MFYGKFDTQSFEIIDKAYDFEWLSDEAMILNQVDGYSDDQQFTSAKAGFDQCYTDV